MTSTTGNPPAQPVDSQHGPWTDPLAVDSISLPPTYTVDISAWNDHLLPK
jgi:hypothetical protein